MRRLEVLLVFLSLFCFVILCLQMDKLNEKSNENFPKDFLKEKNKTNVGISMPRAETLPHSSLPLFTLLALPPQLLDQEQDARWESGKR